MAFHLTDELFGIAISRKTDINPYYSFGAALTAAPPWAVGTMLGIKPVMHVDNAGHLIKVEPMSTKPPAGEDPRFLQEQIITYLGNKRRLLDFIGRAVAQVRKRLGGRKLRCFDAFAGSGIVSRKDYIIDIFLLLCELTAHGEGAGVVAAIVVHRLATCIDE